MKALLLLAMFLITKNEGELIKRPQGVTRNSKKHGGSDEGGSVQTADRRTQAPSEDVGANPNSLQGPNHLPSPDDLPVSSNPKTRVARPSSSSHGTKDKFPPNTNCERILYDWLLLVKGCLPKAVRTAKCDGHCASYLEPIAPQNRKTPGQLFSSKCDCCQSTGLTDTEVRLRCPDLTPSTKQVMLQQPTGCKCEDCLK